MSVTQEKFVMLKCDEKTFVYIKTRSVVAYTIVQSLSDDRDTLTIHLNSGQTLHYKVFPCYIDDIVTKLT